MLLEDAPRPAADDERAVAAMLDGVRQLGIEALPWDPHSRGLQARMQFVHGLQRDDLSDWPASDDAALMASLAQWLGPYLAGITRREQLARLPLADALLGAARRRAATPPRNAGAAHAYRAERLAHPHRLR